MTKYELNLTNIDGASKTVTEFLSNEKVASKEVQRIRLSVEEILLKYLDSLNSGTSFEIVTAKRFRTLKIELVIAGDSMDPFADDDGGGTILNNLLSNLGLAPTWRYKNGKNIITFTAKKQKKLSQILQIGIAILAAIVFGWLCLILPDSVSTFITSDLVTPVFNTFMGLLSAISGPIIFLSVVWGICGIGDMATFGKIGKKMIGRFLLISVLVGLAGTVMCSLMFEKSALGDSMFDFSELYELILDIIPGNLVEPFVSGNSLQIIFIAILVGLAMLVLGNRIPVVMRFIEQFRLLIYSSLICRHLFTPVCIRVFPYNLRDIYNVPLIQFFEFIYIMLKQWDAQRT